jgi:hypothetical protein
MTALEVIDDLLRRKLLDNAARWETLCAVDLGIRGRRH